MNGFQMFFIFYFRHMKLIKLFFLLIVLAIASNCNAQKSLLDSIIHIAERKSIFTKNVNWNNLIPQLYESIDTTKSDSVEAVIPAVEKLYTALGDKHGVLIYKNQGFKGAKFNNNRHIDSNLTKYAQDINYAFRTKILDNNYGYFSIPSATVPLEDSILSDKEKVLKITSEMAQTIKDSLCKLNTKNLKGIILDFRLNIGGSIYLMVDGLASIIGDGKVLSYQYGNGKSENLYLKNGAFFEDSTFASKTDAECNFKKIKIAILISPITASAGEQTVIAFRGKKEYKNFRRKK